jgi:hypothetical protein
MGSFAKQTVGEWCLQNHKRYKTREDIIENCIRSLGVCRKQVVRKLRDLRLIGSLDLNKIDVNISKPVGLNEKDFKLKCDATYIIEEAVKNLPPDRFIPDPEFREFVCKLNANQYRPKSNLPRFEKYKGISGGVVYWSKPENIEKLKKEGVLK